MRRTSRAIAAVGAVAALALTGCSSGGGQSGQSGDAGSSGSATALAASDVNEQPRDALQQGGTLRMTIASMPTNWNMMETDGNTVDNRDIYEFLLSQTANWIFAADGTYEPNTNYLESYDVQDATADKGQVVTLNLNPDAKWNSGRSITWEDYESQWKACNGENEDFLCASTDGFNQIASVEQGDSEFQVVVTFKGAYPDWAGTLSSPTAKEVTADADTFNEGWQEYNNDWTAGPYIVDSVDDAQQLITLVPNPQWWGDKPMLDTVTFRALDASAQGNAFANSEIDILKGIINGDQYAQAATRSDAEVRRAGGLQWRHYTFNSESGVLQDVKVRQAIVKGIDREAVANSDLAGIPDIVPSELMLGNHFFMPGQEGYVDNSADYAYDPTKAGEELDALGWTLNETSGYREKDGDTLEFDYAMMADVPTSKNEGELLQAQLKEIGVKVDITNVESDSFFSDTMPNGKFGVSTFAWQGTQFPMQNVGQIYGCDASLAQNGGSNYSRYCDPTVKELIPQIDTEEDHDTRVDLANQADKAIWDAVETLPIYRRLELTAVPKNLANYGAFGMQTTRAEDIGYVAE
ncbi:ABC transporter family substrate-binding protein [Schaalia naturae]|jgi:peptide/nickel transport system substrate-binding protein|uniref:ABC transporter family substrate-binding protein n=1 Tax=Schaalia naturae TaxID=635203 RepID=A0ABW2SLG9_9ACTO